MTEPMRDPMRLAFRVDGSDRAAPLVLLNSIGTTTHLWDACVPALAEQFRVIRIDWPGHGDSVPAPPGTAGTIAGLSAAVVAVLDTLGVARADLAGVSLGGMAAMWLAIRDPGRVSRLALICTAAHLPPVSQWLDRAAAVRAGGMGALAGLPARLWITPELAELEPGLLDRLDQMLASIDAESYAQCCEALAALDLRPELPRIDVPTVVIAGEQDRATPPQHARLIADTVPGARLEIVEYAAHLVPVEAPETLTKLLSGGSS